MRRTTSALVIALSMIWAGAALADSASYTYDSQGRLASATYSTASGAHTTTYTYDTAGNRTSIVTN